MTVVDAPRTDPRTDAAPSGPSSALEAAAWIGLAARGALYCVVALLALNIAFGDYSEAANKDGALETVAGQPFGRALLVVLAIGFAAYSLWRYVLAFVDVGDEDEVKGWAQRAVNVCRGTLYAFLCFSAIKVLQDASKDPAATDGASTERQNEWTARVFTWPAGRWIVAAVGLTLIGMGIYHIVKAYRQSWKKKLDLSRATLRARRIYTWLANTGLLGRGAIHLLLGWFVVQAAWHYDPNDAVGIDGALRRLAARAWGPWMLGAVALGMFAFGLYSMFVEARFRKVER